MSNLFHEGDFESIFWLLEAKSNDTIDQCEICGVDPSYQLKHSALGHASFSGRSLTGFDFSNADMVGADFANADVFMADFSHATIDEKSLKFAINGQYAIYPEFIFEQLDRKSDIWSIQRLLRLAKHRHKEFFEIVGRGEDSILISDQITDINMTIAHALDTWPKDRNRTLYNYLVYVLYNQWDYDEDDIVKSLHIKTSSAISKTIRKICDNRFTVEHAYFLKDMAISLDGDSSLFWREKFYVRYLSAARKVVNRHFNEAKIELISLKTPVNSRDMLRLGTRISGLLACIELVVRGNTEALDKLTRSLERNRDIFGKNDLMSPIIWQVYTLAVLLEDARLTSYARILIERFGQRCFGDFIGTHQQPAAALGHLPGYWPLVTG